jgi:hypothetical protein
LSYESNARIAKDVPRGGAAGMIFARQNSGSGWNARQNAAQFPARRLELVIASEAKQSRGHKEKIGLLRSLRSSQ